MKRGFMYLKSIEVHGFKSFANKMVFEFHNGITAIVGPNGSGKSNVVDAVRWVFGEQSAKQLRGGNMQDVIFAGTEMRRPQSYAEVAITLDNSGREIALDFEEVKITRRLYRSGESEYLINDRPVRLRDINELFYDTGIGKEGYSIIGQNQIEKILSGKADDRRELFDEAAGIVKFKRRKNAAVKKLEGEQQNLLRVSDILNELTSQLGPLRRQSETAHIYLMKRDSLRELDINLYLLDSEQIEQKITDLSEREGVVGRDLDEARKAFEETRREYDQLEQDIEQLDVEISKAHDEGAGMAMRRQELKGQIEILREQIRTVQSNDEHFESRRAAIRAEIEKRQKDLESESAREIGLDREFSLYQEEQKKEEAGMAAIDKALTDVGIELDAVKRGVIDLLNERASVKSRQQRYDTMLEQIDIRKAELTRRSLRYKEEEIEAARALKEGEEKRSALKEEIETLKDAVAGDEKAVAACQKEIAEGNRKLDEKQTAYHRESSRLESLKNLEEHYDGYGNGIRRVMEEKPNEPGIVGVVAELLVVDKKYELAIETALGSKSRNVVTDDEQTAKRLINFLKKNRLGRATFLPMTHIKDVKRFELRAALEEPGVIGLGSSLVRTAEGYEVLSEYLLGRTLVVDTIDNALKIGAKYRHGLYMVTLQGELFTPGGAITGGAFKSNTTLLGRRREIEELQVRTAELKKETASLTEAVEKVRTERNRLRDEIVTLHEKLQDAYIRQNTNEMKIRQAEEHLTDSHLASETLTGENQEIALQIAQVKDNKGSMDDALRASEDEESRLNERAAALQTKLEELQKERDAQTVKVEAIHVKTAALSEQMSFLTDTVERLNDEIDVYEIEEHELVLSRESGAKEIEEREKKIKEAESEIRDALAEAEACAERERELIDKKSSLSIRHKSFFDKREVLSDTIVRLDKEHYRLTTQKERLEEDREKQTAYMWEEYELTPSEAKALRREDLTDRPALKREVSKLKEEIKGLGNVNVGAIEEYKAVSERHEFLSTQHDDLVKSEETLTHIIEELDAGMRKQFGEHFASINKEFDKVVKALFGGGFGRLELKDSNDVLETDIAITVQPPGKKLQNINLLSGGERALTAIALLFAIQNLKPSPFCLLDEIEAALDENNTNRFSDYLNKLKKNTQFIVITHRRGTMAGADRLYGITMMEKGISTLVSVSLIEDKLDK